MEGIDHIPTHLLEREATLLERRLIDGLASPADIDVFVMVAAELGRRSLYDQLVDPRD